MNVLRPAEYEQWTQLLSRSARYDFYHLPGYHQLAEARGEGRARLFVHADGDHFVALPLLLRPLDGVPGANVLGQHAADATSVYGYCGPVASRGAVPSGVVRDFQASLTETLHRMNVVSVFSRLHPLMAQSALLEGLGEVAEVGQTVSIDLSLSPEAQRAAFRKNHKEGINRLRRQGVQCVHDQACVHLPAFVDQYLETMRRVAAAEAYFFDEEYFRGLVSALGRQAHLFVAVLGHEVVAGGLFIECNGIVQYHLGATRDAYLKLAPMKLIFETVRTWANERGGMTAFHLGGGVGGAEDSLFNFKAGFSDRRHPFRVWRWVPSPAAYEQLCAARGGAGVAGSYFPAYRVP